MESGIETEILYYNQYIRFKFPRYYTTDQAIQYVKDKYHRDYVILVETSKKGLVFKIESPIGDGVPLKPRKEK